jgi:hypothetical protein
LLAEQDQEILGRVLHELIKEGLNDQVPRILVSPADSFEAAEQSVVLVKNQNGPTRLRDPHRCGLRHKLPKKVSWQRLQLIQGVADSLEEHPATLVYAGQFAPLKHGTLLLNCVR